MTTLFIFVRGCIWGVLDFYKLQALSALMGSLDFCSLVFVFLMESLSYMLCVKKCSMTFSLET